MSETEIKLAISIKIKYLRAICGYTQEDVADKCDISTRTVYNIEHGRSVPRLNTVVKLSRCFGVTVDEMMAPNIKYEHNDE